MNKVYDVPRSVIVKDNEGDTKISVVTQLYQIGIYAAVYVNNQITQQLNLTPKQAIKFMDQFKQDNLKGDLISEFGPNMNITSKDGFWINV